MQTRRQMLIHGTLAGSALALRSARVFGGAEARSSCRPPLEQRAVQSAAVEATLARVKALIADPELAWLFENCYPNTLDTAVRLGEVDGKPDTFIVTGDIAAMWLRDSAAQVWPYRALARSDEVLQKLFRGLIHRHARCILIDPYANAFLADPQATQPLEWARLDKTDMKPGVAERKWEIDSLCHVVRLAYGYWEATHDSVPFDAEWRSAMTVVVRTFREQQRREGPGPYRFQRAAENPLDTLGGEGYGAPTRKVGLLHSMFRPSDDACTYPFLVPSNAFAIQSLRQLAQLSRVLHADVTFANECERLAEEVETALSHYGHIRDERGRTMLAYEVDGYGNRLFMDDANIPSLLSLPYLGYCRGDDALYRHTRARLWSPDNPYFFRGAAGEGVGGPHVGLRMIWPMSIMVLALTSDDDAEIRRCLIWLKRSHAGTGFMHEAFDQDDPSHFTRPWFAWANSLFGELILHVAAFRPAVLRQALE